MPFVSSCMIKRVEGRVGLRRSLDVNQDGAANSADLGCSSY